MTIREFIYGTELKRLIMRFLEIGLLAAFSAIINSVELERALTIALPVGSAAMFLKLLRDTTKA